MSTRMRSTRSQGREATRRTLRSPGPYDGADHPAKYGVGLHLTFLTAMAAALAITGAVLPGVAQAATPSSPQVHLDNTKPDPSNDEFTMKQGGWLSIPAPGVLANDNDFDGDVLSLAMVDDPTGGVLNGVWSNGAFNYSPYAGFTGDDTFTYRDWDGTDHSDSVATVTIHVLPANTPPTAHDDFYSVVQGSTLAVGAPGVLVNDSDPFGAPVTLDAVDSWPTHGALLDMDVDGHFSYRPNPGFKGTDSFTYQARSGATVSAKATIHIQVTQSIPITHNDAFVTKQDTTLTVAAPGLVKNDTDAGKNPLVVMGLKQGPAHGQVTYLLTTGGFTYVPKAGFHGTDTFSYYLKGNGLQYSAPATVTITVLANHRPVAHNDTFGVPKNGAVTVKAPGLLKNDTDVDKDALSVGAWGAPAHGTLTKKSATGSFVYTPKKGFVGTDHFNYRASDGHLLSATVGGVSLVVK